MNFVDWNFEIHSICCELIVIFEEHKINSLVIQVLHDGPFLQEVRATPLRTL